MLSLSRRFGIHYQMRDIDETMYNVILFQIQHVQKKITDTFKTADDVDNVIDHLHKMRIHALDTILGPYRFMVLAKIKKCKRALIVARETLLKDAQQEAHQDTQQEAQQEAHQDAHQEEAHQDTQQEAQQEAHQDAHQEEAHQDTQQEAHQPRLT